MRTLLQRSLGFWILLATLMGVASTLFAGVGGARYAMHTLERHGGECGKNPCVSLLVEYPEFIDAGSDWIRSHLNGLVQETLLGKDDPMGVVPVLEAVRDSIIVQRLREVDNGSKEPWSIERRITIIGDTVGVLTFKVTESRYTGGAHGNSMVLLQMVEEKSVKPIGLDELLTPQQKDKLRDVAEPHFRAARGLRQEESLTDAGFTFEDGKFVLTLNVGLTSEGLYFYYNQYEIAPYVMGPTDFTVSWHELSRAGLLGALLGQH